MTVITKIVNETVGYSDGVPIVKLSPVSVATLSRGHGRSRFDDPVWLDLRLIQIGALDPCGGDQDKPMVYAFVWRQDQGAAWFGGAIESSVDGSQDDWVKVASVDDESWTGIVTNGASMTANAVRGQIDRLNWMEVTMMSGDPLESVTLGEMLRGANLIWMNSEVLSFQTAEVLDTTYDGKPPWAVTYKLSVFRRGLMGTPIRDGFDKLIGGGDETYAHQDILALFGPITRICVPAGEIGKVTDYRALSPNADPITGLYQTITPSGTSTIPLPPASIQLQFDAVSGDWTVSWYRVSRAPGQYELSSDGPVDLDPWQAKVDIRSGPGGAVIRTITVEAADQVTYTNAQQVTDFGLTQTSLSLDVYNYTDTGDGLKTVVTEAVDIYGA